MYAPARSLSKAAAQAAGLMFAFLLSLILAVPMTAAAADVYSPEIKRIEAFMAEAEFEQALELVKAELAKSTLSVENTGRLYELQGMLNLYLADEAAAARSFRMLLKESPEYQLQADASPKVRELFERAKAQMAKEISENLKLRHPRPSPAEPGAPIKVEILMENAPKGVHAKLFYRRNPKTGFSDTRFVESEDHKKWVATVPSMDFGSGEDLEPESKSALEYFIQVRGPANALLAIAGKKDSPLTVPFLGNEDLEAAAASEAAASAKDAVSPWYKKWWVWTIVGVVVAGAVTGGVIYALSDQTGKVPISVTVAE